MGGRGSKGSTATRGGTAKGSISIGGSKIEFDGKLGYGKKDTVITAKERKTLEIWEDKRKNQKIEYAYYVHPDGTARTEVKGGKESVRTPSYWGLYEGTLTHIHPRENAGTLGGTFSIIRGDLANFSRNKMTAMRAVAKEGIYTISKNPNFNGTTFYDWAKDVEKKAVDSHNARRRQLDRDYMQNKITREQYIKEATKSFNTCLVEIHNELIKGQKQYHYNYALEKRKK